MTIGIDDDAYNDAVFDALMKDYVPTARWVATHKREVSWKTTGYVWWGYDTRYEKQDSDGFLQDVRIIRTPQRQQVRSRSKYIPAGKYRNTRTEK